MVNQNDTNAARKIDRLSNEKTSRTRTFSSDNFPSQTNLTKIAPINDDVIGSLSDAYENKRARQVSEWERRFVHHAV